MTEIQELKEMLLASQSTIVITGAGISNSSGIADMEKMNVTTTLETSLEPLVRMHPEHSYKLLRESFFKAMFEKGPSLSHRKLAELEEEGLVDGIITTNIDHLHSLAGSQNVAEIQGSYAINRCSKCKVHEDGVDIWNKGKAPRCSICNGIMLSFPVYSHVGVYEPAMKRANQWISQADLVLVVGSKGNYGSYLNNLSSSAKIIQINPHPTQFDSIAVLNIREKADTVFSQL